MPSGAADRIYADIMCRDFAEAVGKKLAEWKAERLGDYELAAEIEYLFEEYIGDLPDLEDEEDE